MLQLRYTNPRGDSTYFRSALEFLSKLESWDFTVHPDSGFSYSGNRGVESLIDYVATDQRMRITSIPVTRIAPKISHRAISLRVSISLPHAG